MALRILIVEDEPVIALHIEGILQDAGHIVVGIVPDMQGALRVATESEVDVATVDVVLAHRPDGVETARRLEAGYGVRSVFVSSMIARARAGSVDFDPVGFIDKPFFGAEILKVLEPLDGEHRPFDAGRPS